MNRHQSKRTAEAVPLLEGYAGGSHRLHAVYPACLAWYSVIPWQLSLRYWQP
nr:MAG TPA: hypothetical protein [Caudoviricetes sp.]DAS16717.1 MAG TPA: hypothetical protein [Caudoviricetes sp.]